MEKVARVGVKKEPGFLYFVDKDGDISRAQQMRGRGKYTAQEIKTKNG
jgi:hypothetical protein